MDAAPTLYAYDPVTGEYTTTAEADPSPLEDGVYLYPAYTTDVAPPNADDHQSAVYQDGAWTLVPDWRGHTYWLSDGTEHTIDEINVSPPADALDAAPPPTLDTLKGARVAALYAACQAGIIGGHPSDALGATHTYPSASTDQINLTAAVTRSLMPGLAADWTIDFWCADDAGAWARRAHTAAQIQQVGDDVVAAISAAQTKLDTLVAQVNAAADQASVEAVAW